MECNNKKIKVHKIVLALHSPVFAAMFKPPMKEAAENKVEITDFSFEIVEKIVQILYDRNLVPDFTINEFLKIFFEICCKIFDCNAYGRVCFVKI
uniref:BTB domain-containing protein n=1 Tax=Panagrolaimus superbus TaxID=310955 RepID=A0A914Z0J2_9BILA